MRKIPYKIYLTEDEMPRTWLNVRAVMPEDHPPLLNPGTGAPVTRAELAQIFCEELADQELNRTDLEIPIPEEIRSFYKMYRPSPLVRAYCLEQALDTPAQI